MDPFTPARLYKGSSQENHFSAVIHTMLYLTLSNLAQHRTVVCFQSLCWDEVIPFYLSIYHSTPQPEAEESQPCKSADSLFFLCLPELLANIKRFVEPHGLPIGQAYWNTSAKGGCVGPSNHTQKRKAFPLLDGMSEEKVFTFLHSCKSQGMAKQEWKLRKTTEDSSNG